jgi:hypothetical protein
MVAAAVLLLLTERKKNSPNHLPATVRRNYMMRHPHRSILTKNLLWKDASRL